MLRNKSLLLVSLVLLLTCTLNAQKKFRPSLNLSGADEETWNFGVLFGYNQFDMTQDFPEGLNIRLTAERNLRERLDLRIEPGIIFQKEPINKDDPSFTEIQFPFLLKYSSNRVGNVNPFILGGYQPVYRLYDPSSSEPNALSHYFETGLGLDFYLRKSKASLHVRLIKNLSSSQDNSGNLSTNSTNGLFIGLSVETRDGWKLYRQ